MSNGGRPPNGRTNLVNLGGHGGQNVKKEDALPTGGHVASLKDLARGAKFFFGGGRWHNCIRDAMCIHSLWMK